MFDTLDTPALAKIRDDIAPTNVHADEFAMSAVAAVRILLDEEIAKRAPISPVPEHSAKAGEDDHHATKKK